MAIAAIIYLGGIAMFAMADAEKAATGRERGLWLVIVAICLIGIISLVAIR